MIFLFFVNVCVLTTVCLVTTCEETTEGIVPFGSFAL